MFTTELTAKEVSDLVNIDPNSKEILNYLKAMTEKGQAFMDKHRDALDCLLFAAVPSLMTFADERGRDGSAALHVMITMVAGVLISEGIIKEETR